MCCPGTQHSAQKTFNKSFTFNRDILHIKSMSRNKRAKHEYTSFLSILNHSRSGRNNVGETRYGRNSLYPSDYVQENNYYKFNNYLLKICKLTIFFMLFFFSNCDVLQFK